MSGHLNIQHVRATYEKSGVELLEERGAFVDFHNPYVVACSLLHIIDSAHFLSLSRLSKGLTADERRIQTLFCLATLASLKNSN